jgi:hypothetical protein
MNKTIVIEQPSALSCNGMHRAQAMVNDVPLWFETKDVPLRPAPEAFVLCLLVSSLHHQRPMECAAPVCPDFAGGIDQIIRLFASWWNYAPLRPRLALGKAAPVRAKRTALFFTGGVDCFHSLVTYPKPIDALVFLLPRVKPESAALMQGYLRRVAQARGVPAIFVQANLLYHPAYRGANWWQTHGSALAAVAHLLSDHYGAMVISSTGTFESSAPTGCHFKLDPLWSSSCLEMVHWGAERTRLGKLRAMADDPFVQTFLVPCHHPTAQGNCSRCEKCLRTQLGLLVCGKLDRFATFDQRTSLARRIDAVAPVANPHLFEDYDEFLAAGVPADVAAAIKRFLARSRRHVAWRAWANKVRRLLGMKTTIERQAAEPEAA